MNAEILSVGTELLLGEILNTNEKYLSQELAALGVDIVIHMDPVPVRSRQLPPK